MLFSSPFKTRDSFKADTTSTSGKIGRAQSSLNMTDKHTAVLVLGSRIQVISLPDTQNCMELNSSLPSIYPKIGFCADFVHNYFQPYQRTINKKKPWYILQRPGIVPSQKSLPGATGDSRLALHVRTHKIQQSVELVKWSTTRSAKLAKEKSQRKIQQQCEIHSNITQRETLHTSVRACWRSWDLSMY